MQFLRTRTHKLYSDGRLFDMKADLDEKKPLTDDEPDSQRTREILQAALEKLPKPKGRR